MKKRIAALITAALLLVCMMPLSSLADGTRYPTPDGYNDNDYQKLVTFLELVDENGVKNGEKLSENYDPLDPATWKGTTWENGRIVKLTLMCGGKNLIGILDVSNCTALKDLICNENQLTSLDVSGCTALEDLCCSENQLTALDVSGCTALTELACDNNQLTSLNLETNYNFPIDRVEALGKGFVGFQGVTGSNNEFYGGVYAEAKPNSRFIGWYDENDELLSSQLYFSLYNVDNRIFIAKFGEGLEWYNDNDYQKLVTFLELVDENGVKNGEKLSENYDPLDPMTWEGASWVSGRIVRLFFDSKNLIGTLDVSGCTALAHLDCGDNQLTSLDVSDCTALKQIYCRNNQLTSLDVSGCTALTDLSCNDNQLTSLDVSDCTALTDLYCSDNQLTALDVSGCTALTYLYCCNNQLTSLNMEANYNLPIDRVESLGKGFIAIRVTYYDTVVYAEPRPGSAFIGWYDENDALLSSKANFDFSSIDNKIFIAKFGEGLEWYNDNDYQKLVTFLELVDENGVRNGEKLSESYDPQDPTTWEGTTWVSGRIVRLSFGSKNLIGTLDVSGCTALAQIDCWNNQLTSLDVSSCTALTELDCGSNQLTELDVSNCTALKDLSCGKNQLVALDVSNNTALESLECQGRLVYNFGAYYNIGLNDLDVSNNAELTELDCSVNQLTSLDVSKNTALTNLRCYSNQLTSLDVSNNVALEWLECSGNKFATIDLSKNTALTVFSCESCELTSIDFSNNTALEEIWLRNNQLAELDVSKNTGISALNCSGNKIAHMDLRDNYKLPVDEIRATNDGGYIGVDLHVWNWQPTNWQPTKGYYLGVWAEAKSGYNFVGWYDENDVCISTEARLPIFDIDNKVFIAKFEEGSTDPTPTPTPEQPTPTPTPEQPTPTPTPEQPTDGVTVDFNHNGGTVEYTYDEENYLLTLYITPKAGYYAKSISVNGSVVAENPTNPYVLDMRPYMKKSEVDAEIFVEFALIPGMRRVTVSSSSCGTVDVNMPDGSYTVDTDGSYLVNAGTELTLTMKPDANHYVWYVAVNGSVTAVRPGNVIKFTVETDMDITVVFRTDAAETTPAPTNPTKPPKTGAISATAIAVTAVLGGAAMLIKRKK